MTTETMVQQAEVPENLAQPFSLEVAKVKGELTVLPPEDAVTPEDPAIAGRADEALQKLLSLDPNKKDEARNAIDGAGGRHLREASHRSGLLKGRLGELQKRSEDGGPVADALINLRDEVRVLNPGDMDFSKPSGWAALFQQLPFVGNPIKRYFNRFETGQGVIDEIIKSLEAGKKTLQNDNRHLAEDQKAWRENTLALMEQIAFLQAVDSRLEAQIPGIADEMHRSFLEEEIQFPLRQRVMDLQQRLAVNQQGVLVAEVLIRNNRELIRGVDRALFVTVDALQVAVAAAMALANQKLVLDAIDALNTTTNTVIADTAKRLRSQGADIHKRASSTTLDSEVLKQAFVDINAAIDDINTYRKKALSSMGDEIKKLEVETQKAEEAIKKMERGNAAAHEGEFADFLTIEHDARAA